MSCLDILEHKFLYLDHQISLMMQGMLKHINESYCLPIKHHSEKGFQHINEQTLDPNYHQCKLRHRFLNSFGQNDIQTQTRDIEERKIYFLSDLHKLKMGIKIHTCLLCFIQIILVAKDILQHIKVVLWNYQQNIQKFQQLKHLDIEKHSFERQDLPTTHQSKS